MPTRSLPENPSPADTFIQCACLDYGDWRPAHLQRARQLLNEHPELARETIYAAAAAGDVAGVGEWLARGAATVNRKGGPHGWEPLLYACYSRMEDDDPGRSTLEAARRLLEAGADPNAGFLCGGLVPAFTALTGAFGGGEDSAHQPRHPHRDPLARLLLDHGADPNDGQALYNLHFEPNDDHLKLLLSYGLGRPSAGPWTKRVDHSADPGQLLAEELWSAARRGYFERVRLLIEHGTAVDVPGSRDGRTPYEAAVRAGHHEIAAYLLGHGARKVEPSEEDAFAAACVAGQRAQVKAMLSQDPKRVETLGRHRRIEILHRAVEARRLESIRLMAELGFEISGMTTHDNVGMNLTVTPLHNAAWSGHLDMVRLLVELGADPRAVEPNYHATPLGWAAHNHQEHVVAYLVPFATLFDAVRVGAAERVAELLQSDSSLASLVDHEGRPLAFYLSSESPRLHDTITVLRAHGVDLSARDKKGRTALDLALSVGDEALADALQGPAGTSPPLGPPGAQ
jgi:ankyrin repeat protein